MGKRKKRTGAGAKRGRPIADKLAKRMNRYVREKVIDLEAVRTGKEIAQEMQETVATREDLAGLHPAHAIYVYAQNQASVMAEQLTALKERDRFVRLLSKAEEHVAAYERHMKFGPARDYCLEFVFKAYVDHRFDVIFLKGLPDVSESLAHSRVTRK